MRLGRSETSLPRSRDATGSPDILSRAELSAEPAVAGEASREGRRQARYELPAPSCSNGSGP